MNQTAEQFWSRVAIGEPNACWEWTGYRSPAGYGQTAWKGKVWLAHRVALSLVDNDWGNKLPVCHSCDLPPCCNPTIFGAERIGKTRTINLRRGARDIIH